MRRSIMPLLTICIGLGIGVLSCKTNPDKELVNKENSNRLTGQDYLNRRKDSLRKRLDIESAKLDSMFRRVKSQLAAETDVTETRLVRRSDFLEDRQKILRTKYKELESATEESWNDIETEINEYLDSLRREDELYQTKQNQEME